MFVRSAIPSQTSSAGGLLHPHSQNSLRSFCSCSCARQSRRRLRLLSYECPVSHRNLRFHEIPDIHPPLLAAGLLSLSVQKGLPPLLCVKARVRNFAVPLYFAYFYASAAASVTAPRDNGRTRRNLSKMPRLRSSGTMFPPSLPHPFSATGFSVADHRRYSSLHRRISIITR